MLSHKILPIALICFMTACKTDTFDKKRTEKERKTQPTAIQVHGHRGDRGNFPENSIPAFISAVRKGADVLELDVVVSKDRKIVVSHEPYMASAYMLKPNGDPIPAAKAKNYKLYEMPYDSIKSFDGGSKTNPHFPHQKKMKTYKPLLSEVFDTVAAFTTKEKRSPVQYNIEIKSKPEAYGNSQPFPEEFVNLVIQLIDQKKMREQVIIQSFDPKILQVLHQTHPKIKIAYLTSTAGISSNLSSLGFKPAIYSPNFKLIKNKKFVDSVHQMGMQLVPWTVNETEAIEKMIRLEVDGIISDYPEKITPLKKQQ